MLMNINRSIYFQVMNRIRKIKLFSSQSSCMKFKIHVSPHSLLCNNIRHSFKRTRMVGSPQNPTTRLSRRLTSLYHTVREVSNCTQSTYIARQSNNKSYTNVYRITRENTYTLYRQLFHHLRGLVYLMQNLLTKRIGAGAVYSFYICSTAICATNIQCRQKTSDPHTLCNRKNGTK